ncbi:Dynein light chain Tctex-type 1 [Chlorella vulgaris]
MAAVAAALPPPQLLDPLALADFEAGLDGLHENDLVDEAEVDSIVREAILHTIGETPWTDSKVASWTSHIIEGTLKKLAALQKPMKYVCKVGLTQRSGAGLHAACCSRWNPKTDGQLSVHWESQTVLVLVTVFWVAL